MNLTTGMALVLTVVAGWLVGCATAPSSRADKEALLAEAASTLQRMRAEHPGVDLNNLSSTSATPCSPR